MKKAPGNPVKSRRAGRNNRLLILFLACCCLAAGCAVTEPPRRTSHHQPYQQFGKWYTPITDSTGFTQTGIASWYGNKFHGKPTASGEIYNMYAMTAAHTTLPLGTYVKVTSLENGREVVVRINDRGPFVDGRIIDLSYLAASKIGIAEAGIEKVRIIALADDYKHPPVTSRELAETALPPDALEKQFTLQLGSFTERQNAVNLRTALEKQYGPTRIVIFHDGRRTFYRVRMGRYATRKEGESARRNMISEGFANVTLLTED